MALLSGMAKVEDEWIDWWFLEGIDLLEPLEEEGYRWLYLGKHVGRGLGIEYVLIEDEFPGWDVVVSKKIIDPRLAKRYELVPIGPDTKRAAAKYKILEYYKDRPGPIEIVNRRYDWAAVIHPATRPGVAWQGSKFDKDGPYGHVEAQSEGEALDQLLEDGFNEPEAGALQRLLGPRANPYLELATNG